jgi:hypothetical protein
MMTALDIPAINSNDLRAESSGAQGKIALRFAGSADSRSLSALEAMLARVHEEALRIGVDEVSVDFREFAFVNSSCFKAFIVWLEQIQELDGPKQYRIRFLSDGTKEWQRRSLGALTCFAMDLVHIDAKGPAGGGAG